jgi:RND family efflux transporter MFP subunit
MPNEFAQSWLDLQCRMIAGVHRAILILSPGGDAGAAPAAVWPNAQQDTALLAESGRLALKKRAPIVRPRRATPGGPVEGPVVVACPLYRHDQLFGVVALEVETLDEQQQHTLLNLLKWGAAWLELLPHEDGTSQIATRLATVIDVTAKGLEQPSLQAAAGAVIAQLAQHLGCDRVSFGLRENRHFRVQALSHSAQIDRRSELVRRIEAAMDEALDEGATVVLPAPAEIPDVSGLPAHERLCGDQGAAVCTLLLVDAGEALGALTLERRQGPPFDRATIDLCEAVAALLGPIFELKRLQDRPFPVKARDAVGDALGALVGRRHLRAKLLAAGLLGLGVWLSLATGAYRISATAVLEGTEQRALVAPIDGYVEQAYARAGELVRQGDLIAELDDRDLELERRRWSSERDDLGKRLGRAIGSFDRAEAAIIEAQLGKANAQLALVEEQLARTRIVAPIDGVIVSGDLSRSLGAPVERGQVLFELAPLDAYRMALQVPEGEIAHVRPGQHGHLALSAMPGEHLAFVVDDIIGIAETADGENGFRVEARLVDTGAQLRPGMRGVGKIEVDERRLLWVWSHTLLDRISLWLWSRLP